ncbi:MAG: phosphoglycerate dehydrogenase [Verrucomicrobia bacterium CG_4_10_14_3_um_filter_43_23]|nr:MAG: phosphoglycerate dehydrogenase [Verrucomicrobia bacterium CG1_02_43_26]PIP58893.1 MAG: phosphoglycerate dehydrogenase [Verrucomicrobia bacterium CG22_combo_CG10-13_8_21_14_all_43_17]PIX58730.1 MAG: phosphoglycerate dehydrogenase [Verrucomicrobia bacterium CG_4_10_14_3_um_filter_43_23]PIY62940.1 MAG: phosphoglycerate dehydrogenase [Verrucomicrobia bacterium CG_4_10_14_0_8_um_filter_43_34]PJA43909.1 MAG: phosphoglycerate dehydrogenase [Verrucomicrobia bacterium CG_4_9_14_3_um_filter_43_20
MKILVADRISSTGIDYLKQQNGLEVIEQYEASPEERISQVQGIDALIVRSATEVTAAIINAARNLRVIGRAGVGVDNIDLEAATEKGIIVLNTPTGNTIATAELTFTHIMCSARLLPQANQSMKAGEWDKKSFSGNELRGKVLGVIGAGRIGAEVAKRAQSFEMDVLAYDPFLTKTRASAIGVTMVSLDDLFKNADYITVHVPLTEDSQYLLDESAFAKMKKGVRVFNCARGGIIKESALIQAVKSGKVAAAGLDVFENEPLSKDSELRNLPNVVLTPHLGASTKEAQESVGLEVAEAITSVLRGGMIRNALNMPSIDLKTLETLRPYLSLGERLGHMLQQMTGKDIEQLKVTYWGKLTEMDLLPLTRAIQRGYLKNICGEYINDVNAPAKFKQLGISLKVTNSSDEADFTDLIRVEAIDENGKTWSLEGTLIGKQHNPRVVHMNGYELEFRPDGHLLLIGNKDVPGVVGMVGSILGMDGVNIANMALSRCENDGLAMTVFELDTELSDKAFRELAENAGIVLVQMIKL